MEILVRVNRNPLYFQEVVVRELMIFPENKILIQFVDQEFNIPKFKSFETFVDRRFSNYNRSPFEKSGYFLSNQNIRYEVLNPKVHFPKVIINLTNNEVETSNSFKTITPIFNFDVWYNNGISRKGFTNIYIKISENKFTNCKSLSFQSEIGVFNNISKALFYLPYLISKTINGQTIAEQNPENKLIVRRNSFIPYFHLFCKILKRKIVQKKYSWKLAQFNNGNITRISQPEKSFWADPFPLADNGKMYIFFEEFNFDRNLGEISVGELVGNEIENKKRVLTADYHLSFPNVFKFDGGYYMMPEQSGSNKLEIYKSLDFPLFWEKHRILLKDLKIVDTILFFHENKYWLFCNKIEPHENDNNERLYIYYSDEIFGGNWKNHQQNPVKVDKRCARNAGQIFIKDKTIFRKYQDCSSHYGGGVGVGKIVKLDVTTFEEEHFENFPAPKNCAGMHTMNEENEICIVDLLIEEK